MARSHRRENFSTTDRWRSFNYSDHLSATVPSVVSIVSEDSKFLSPFHALISPLDHFSLSTSASFLSSPHGFASFSRIRNSTDANLLILAMIFFEFYQFRPLIRDFYHFWRFSSVFLYFYIDLFLSRIRNSTDVNFPILSMIFLEFYQFRLLIRDFYHFSIWRFSSNFYTDLFLSKFDGY